MDLTPLIPLSFVGEGELVRRSDTFYYPSLLKRRGWGMSFFNFKIEEQLNV